MVTNEEISLQLKKIQELLEKDKQPVPYITYLPYIHTHCTCHSCHPIVPLPYTTISGGTSVLSPITQITYSKSGGTYNG
jgi:hypothetical protein